MLTFSRRTDRKEYRRHDSDSKFCYTAICRLDSILSELINRSERILSCQPLTNPDISNSIDLTQDSCCFENQDSYTPFLEHSLEETSYLEKSIEILQEFTLQFQKSSAQSINRLETQLSQLVNIYRNKKILSYQFLTNSDISNSIDLTQDSCVGPEAFHSSFDDD